MRTLVVLVALLVGSAAQAQTYKLNNGINAKWQEWVRFGQRNKWERGNSCFAQDGDHDPYCSLSLTSPVSDGKRIRLLEIYDTDQNLQFRMMCEESTMFMIRTCMNMENNYKEKEMYDTDTKTWKQIK